MPDDRQNGSTGDRGSSSGNGRLRRAAKATRSGLKRYPRALVQSLRDPRGLRAHLGHTPLVLPDLSGYPLAAVWLGHASTLVRLAGMNILADPVFAHRIGLNVGGYTFGLQRHRPAPVREEGLPPIDLILISHAHFDHLDRPTLRRLASVKTTVVTARHTRGLIPEGFGHVLELDWDRALHFRGLNIEAIRPAHWGARTAIDRRRGYNSYILRDNSPSRHSRGVLLAGDTAYTDAFTRVTDLALAVMGIGSYDPWTHAHATPEETWEMFSHTGAPKLLPVHHSTFPLGDEAIDEPMERLMTRAGGSAQKVISTDQGQVWTGE